MADVDLQVEGMDCHGCEESIRNSVSRLERVMEVVADHRTGRVHVAFDGEAPEPKVREAIEDAGFQVVGPAVS